MKKFVCLLTLAAILVSPRVIAADQSAEYSGPKWEYAALTQSESGSGWTAGKLIVNAADFTDLRAKLIEKKVIPSDTADTMPALMDAIGGIGWEMVGVMVDGRLGLVQWNFKRVKR